MYKDKFGITKIRDTKIDNLSISYDENEEDGKKIKTPILLHAPYIDDKGHASDHSHIQLSREQAILLRDWINDYLEDTRYQKRFTPMPKDQQDVHTEHCCKEHGCKYGNPDCPVETGVKTQSYPCEMCE